MSAAAPLPNATRSWTTSDFLAWESGEDLRFEFDGFHAIAMTGGNRRHHQIVGNLRRALEAQVARGCQVFTETFKLQCRDRVRYPDVMVTCHPILDDASVTDAAVFVAEVVSPSSVHTDRVEKLEDYSTVPGLEAYLIVDPVAQAVTLYARTANGLEQVEAADPIDLRHDLTVALDTLFEHGE